MTTDKQREAFEKAWPTINESANVTYVDIAKDYAFAAWLASAARYEPLVDVVRRFVSNDDAGVQFESNANGPDYWRCALCNGSVRAIYDPPGQCTPFVRPFPHDNDCPIVEMRVALAKLEGNKCS